MAMVLIAAPAAYGFGFLDLAGTLTAAAMGIVVGFSIGPSFLGLLILFLVVNSVFTRLGYVKKALNEAAEPKGGRRTWTSVVSNGLVGTVFAGFHIAMPSPVFYVGFLAAIAASSADTAATEIGLLSRVRPFMITTFKRVEPGVSGGVTPLGFVGALVGALTIALVAYLIVVLSHLGFTPSAVYAASKASSAPLYLVAVVVGGFVGAISDSVLGATVQARYKCSKCGRITEKPTHCSGPSTLSSGLDAIDNDVVNILATVLGSASGVLVFALI